MTATATDTSGKYVKSVGVANGVITITFGNKANKAIDTKTLALTPYQTPDNSVAWRCGYATDPAGTNPLGTGTAQVAVPATGNIDVKYVPAACRAAG
jgi:type IV pilus assembly protein PilA